MMIATVFMGLGIHIAHALAKDFRARHPASMTRDQINALCAALPGAENSDPWGGGHDAWKVGGKMFASMGTQSDSVAVKTDSVETAQMLIDAGIGSKAPYFHRSWLHLPCDADPEEIRHRIHTSYALIRAKLPRKLQAGLG